MEAIFPLHDHNFNKLWMTKWSTTTLLKAEDLDEIRDKLGEKVDHIPLTNNTAHHLRSHSTSPSLSPILYFSLFQQFLGSRLGCSSEDSVPSMQ